MTKIRTLMIPALFGVSVSQINLLLDTFIASFLMSGSISWLYYSDRLLEFPLGLFGIAIATVILPALSSRHVDKSADEFSKTLDWGIRTVVLLGLPAMAGLIVLAEPMLMVLFMRGEFTPEDARLASYSLFAYGSGLLSFMLVKVLATGFYSRQDTKRPVKYGIIAMVSNMVFNIIFAIPFGYVGLAIATSLSAAVNAGLLGYNLWRDGVLKRYPGTLTYLTKVTVAVVAMVAVVLYLAPARQWWLAAEFVARVWQLVLLIGAGAGTYLIFLLLLRVKIR